jgi:hypothetical protein
MERAGIPLECREEYHRPSHRISLTELSDDDVVRPSTFTPRCTQRSNNPDSWLSVIPGRGPVFDFPAHGISGAGSDVMFLFWKDLNPTLRTVRVLSKPDLKFIPKRWEEREVPVPSNWGSCWKATRRPSMAHRLEGGGSCNGLKVVSRLQAGRMFPAPSGLQEVDGLNQASDLRRLPLLAPMVGKPQGTERKPPSRTGLRRGHDAS